MNREEAIRCLSVHSSTNGSGLCTDKQHYEAKQMAIKALEQEPVIEPLERFAESVAKTAKVLERLKVSEQEPILDRDCEHCSKTYGTFGCCTTVNNKWVYSCKEGQREYLLDKIKAEMLEEMLSHSGTGEEVIQAYADGLKKGLEVIDKYRKEHE